MSKKIFASNDKNAYAFVDDDIAEIIQEMCLKFSVNNNGGYFRSTTEIKLPGITKKKRLYLHHFVWLLKTREEPTSEIDHIDINPANNMFENLRLATRQEQNQHQRKRKSNTSGYTGVSHKHNVDKRGNGYDYWYSSIQRPDNKREVKSFSYTEAGKIAAGKWYDQKAIEYFHEFHGDLNFPDDN